MSAPLQSRPGAIWSLWDMIERHAGMFAEGFADLTEAKHLAALYSMQGNQPPEPGIRRLTRDSSHRLRQALIYAEMGGLIPSLDRLDMMTEGPGQVPLPNLAQAIMHTLSGIRDHLESEYFFHLDQHDVPLYLEPQPFGEAVGKKFPNATEDIAEAARCLALQRPTATVFHLMRVMELALRALARKLKVTTINPNVENWNKITDHVNKAINALPAKTSAEQKKKAQFGAASAHLNSVRIAWRNEVMHPKQSYSREEAHAIFAAVRGFMADLAAL
jgi:hypothetical protein